jgi:uncharacterized membrane protein
MRRLVLAAALLSTSMAVEAADLFEVSGVAVDDVLNLRAGPNAGAPLVGALPPTASGITAERQNGAWWYVRFGDKEGWVASRFLRPARKHFGEAPPLPLQCHGTEPFWSLTLAPDRAWYETPEETGRSSEVADVRVSRNSRAVWSVRFAGGPVGAATLLVTKLCSDGMSDEIYPIEIALERSDGAFLSGCCSPEQ